MARVRFGHTCITWKDANVTRAVATIAAAGFAGFETFSWVVNPNQEDGGLRRLIVEHGIPLVSCYDAHSLLDDGKQAKDFETIPTTARNLTDLGCSCVVLGAGGRAGARRIEGDAMRRVIANAEEVARRYRDYGMVCCFHPHTGTAIETGDEIDRFMRGTDPDLIRFAPDTGQIQKGGADPVAVVRDHVDRIGTVHLKDFIGRTLEVGADGKLVDPTGFLGYTPLGEGVVDFRTIMDVLNTAGYEGWLMVELDNPNESASRSPEEAVRVATKYITSTLGYSLDEPGRNDA